MKRDFILKVLEDLKKKNAAAKDASWRGTRSNWIKC